MTEKDLKTFTLKEIAEHNSEDSLWLLIDNSVFDVTKFKEEHPGGPEPLLDYAGQEATDAFEEVGHSSDARSLMKDYKIGELCQDERKKKVEKASDSKPCCCLKYIIVPLGVAVTALLAYQVYARMHK